MSDNPEAPVDLRYLREYTDGDSAALQELLEIFTVTFVDELENFKRASFGENAEWCAVAHKLKGASAFIGAETLRKLCARAQGMKSATVGEREEVCREVIAQYERVNNYMKDMKL